MNRLVLMTLMTASLAACTRVPETPKEPVTDDYHGTQVVDPYRWLEGNDAPEIGDKDEALARRVAEWTEAQNEYTRSRLDNIPGREALEDRLAELLEVGSVGLPDEANGRYFYTERRGDQNQPVVKMREGHDGEPVTLINPNEMDESGLTALAWFEPSQDGGYLAYGTYEAGDENATLHVLDVDSGEVLPDTIPGKVNGVHWMPDNESFLYRNLADVENPYSGQVKFHTLGDEVENDPLIFEQYKEGPLATTWGPMAYTNDEAKWLVLSYWTSTRSNDLWVYDFEKWRETGELERTDIVTGEEATSTGPVVGDTLYMFTKIDAPNGRVVAVDLNNPSRDNWKTVVPESDTAVIESVSAAEGRLVVEYLENAYSRIELFDYDGGSLGEVDLPGIGSASITTRADATEAFFHFESFDTPDSIYRVDLASGERELWAQPDVPVDPDIVEVKQVWYESKDGTPVSMFLVHRKGIEKTGDRPTILYGYGGFNISMTPSFAATRFPWLEAGGIYAIANLRGGGEYGESWHRAGMLEKKQNVFDDFIAAGEYLIEEGYTSKEKLGVYGGSNGGLLTGAVVTQRPELFGAVISAVPLLDMLRYQHFLMARYWVPEYGDAEQNPEHFEFLYEYSPYHNVEKGVEYPATFFTAGENDTRVHALHARKMAARMQAATASDPETDPVLLWVEQEAGHGQGKPLKLRVRDVADVYGFMGWQLGLEFGEAL